MTRGKAIEIIEYHKILVDNDKSGLLDKDLEYEAINKAIKALGQEPNTWSLDDAREDFMHDVYSTLDFLPTNEEANRIIDIFDRVTSDLEQETCEDCISRQAAIDAVEHITSSMSVCVNSDECHGMKRMQGMAVRALEKLPPAQPESEDNE